MGRKQRQYIIENKGKKSSKQIALDLGLKEKKVKRYLRSIDGKRRDRIEVDITSEKVSWIIVASLLASLALIIFGVYANAINGPFLFDDKALVEQNVFIKDVSNIPNFFKTDIFSSNSSKPVSNSYRPMQIISHAIDFFIYGNNPRGSHVTNILLHILNAVLVFFVIRKIINDIFIAYFTALLFGIHPVNTSCVTYISGRADLLSITFVLISLLSYFNYNRSKNIAFLILSATAYFFAVCSKEYAIFAMPLILFLYHITFDKKNLFMPLTYLFYGVPLAFYFFMRTQALHGLAHLQLELSFVPLLPRVLTSLKTLFFDFRILLFPYDLHFARGVNIEYSLIGNNGNPIFIILGLAIVLYFLLLLHKQYEKKKRVETGAAFFGMLWFFVSMLPLLNIFPLQAFYSESWLYFPSIGVYLAIFASAKHFLRPAQEKIGIYGKIVFVTICLVSTCYGVVTVLRNNDYLSEERFYFSNIKHRPVTKFCIALADIYVKKHDFGNAVKYAKMAEELSRLYAPSDDTVSAYYILGYAYMETQKLKESEHYFNMVLSSNRDDLKNNAKEYLNYIQQRI